MCDTDAGTCASSDGAKVVPWTQKGPASYAADAPPESARYDALYRAAAERGRDAWQEIAMQRGVVAAA